MKVGICGYPGSGKSTVFLALAPGARTTGDVALGNIGVPDPRVDELAVRFTTKKKTYAVIDFVDIAGSAAASGAFPPDVVQGMRNADVLVHVVRGFENPALSTEPDPARDVRLFDEELLLLDLGVMEKRADRMKRENAKGPATEVTAKCIAHIEGGAPLRTLPLSDDERATLTGVQLLSLRPLIVLYNLSEAMWADAASAPLRNLTTLHENALSLGICGSIEAEIAAMDEADQKEMLDGLGLGEAARNVFIRAAYRLLDLISFLTAGEDECRAWPIRRGWNARKAASKIHSDIERGFIRAEVYRMDDLRELGSEAALKAAGRLRVEGKDYIVQDGDVMNFRFNV